jgi:hypothetical protein
MDHVRIIATKSTRKASHKEAQKAHNEEDGFSLWLYVPFCG